MKREFLGGVASVRAVQRALLDWYARQGRRLPWRETSDPYRVIVAEFMLQQTQVERVLPKFASWLDAFPDWASLARAPRRKVLQLWSGLGYNHRALRLHRLAGVVAQTGLPRTEHELLRLPGIGPYTAGAIMAFAFQQPGACVDVNVSRVVKRLFFSRRQRPTPRRVVQAFLESFPEGRARDWANAVMDLGAGVCVAAAPRCAACPLRSWCRCRGERPEEERERRRRRQGVFFRSNRWWRGAILKALVAQALPEEQLYRSLGVRDRRAFRKALGELRAEGFVHGEALLSVDDES